MKHFLLLYTTADDYLERRDEYRSEHLRPAWRYQERGDLVLAGALTEPADGAVLLFQGDTAAAAEEFANSDPYVANGLIREWEVREWNTVVGNLAVNPLRSAD
jgi:uncharacterized protein YciI